MGEQTVLVFEDQTKESETLTQKVKRMSYQLKFQKDGCYYRPDRANQDRNKKDGL